MRTSSQIIELCKTGILSNELVSIHDDTHISKLEIKLARKNFPREQAAHIRFPFTEYKIPHCLINKNRPRLPSSTASLVHLLFRRIWNITPACIVKPIPIELLTDPAQDSSSSKSRKTLQLIYLFLFSTVLPSNSCCFCPVGLSLL